MNSQEVTELRDQHYNATVVSIRKANPDLWIFRIKPDFPIPDHKPGQYTTLGMGTWEPRAPGCQEEKPQDPNKPKLIRRAYSISCSVLDDQGNLLPNAKSDHLEYYIVLVRDSGRGGEAPALTPRLFLLEEGDRVFLGEKITGHYHLDEAKPEQNFVFLATGTGEAPHNYMVWELLNAGHPGKIVSVCCVRYLRDLGYLEMHEKLAEKYPNYSYIWLTTREAAQKNNKKYIQDYILSGMLEEKMGSQLTPETSEVFLCGNPKMIGVPETDKKTKTRTYPTPQGVIEILEGRGFQLDDPRAKIKGNIHIEEYW